MTPAVEWMSKGSKANLSSREVRQGFLDFFKRQKHQVVASGSLVPQQDPTLLFTNAGMNQFKAVFTGQEKRNYKRATSSQKCVRAGGKHNDLENVGRTRRHHTFFEMLGNFSFGDYSKKDAIRLAWDFVTQDLSLPQEKLYVSVFQDDDEAFGIWRDDIGLEERRIYRFGAKDNFWSMGDAGPCGPCSEIFFDQGENLGCGQPSCDVGCECDRYVEFWNLVFMEFEQQADGSRIKLPAPSVDTGMGLERVSAIVQGAESNYDTDLFAPIFAQIRELCGKDYLKTRDEEVKTSMRVVADHIRAITFLIFDGILPSNEGRGYVLRRIMRRAMRHGRRLGLPKLGLSKLSGTVVRKMGEDHYPELKTEAKSIAETVAQEEERFDRTIDRGLALLQEEIRKVADGKGKVLSGVAAFRLYDTYGFPVDLTADILREHQLTYDEAAFEEAFASHRERARGSWKGADRAALDALVARWTGKGMESQFLGYESLTAEGTIQALVKDGKEVKKAKEGDSVELMAEQTPFYGESGGQVGDIGMITGNGFSIEVIDTQKPNPKILLHQGKVTEGEVRVGDTARFSVDENARGSTAKNHTATHLLHSTLREVLGTHVKQKGSWVGPERLRFDFTHPRAVSSSELAQIERIVNERIWADGSVQKEILPLDQALAAGAVALFDEKYGDEVRVVSVGDYSMELCGGTHLNRTGEIGIFKVVKEGSVAAGVRRLEAYTSLRALRQIEEMDRKLHEVATLLGSSPEGVVERAEKLLAQQKELRKKGGSQIQETKTSVQDVKKIQGVSFLAKELTDIDHRQLREVADRHLEHLKSGIVAIGSHEKGKAFVVVKVSKDLTARYKAGDLVKSAAKILGGSGGGRPEMAQAGGPATDKLDQALAAVADSLE